MHCIRITINPPAPNNLGLSTLETKANTQNLRICENEKGIGETWARRGSDARGKSNLAHLTLVYTQNVVNLTYRLFLAETHGFLHGNSEFPLQHLQILVWRQIETVETCVRLG